MKKLSIIIFDQVETDCRENIEFVWWLACEYHTECSWFTSDKLGTLTLFSCVVKPLNGQVFNWNCFVDIDSEGKIWKSVHNSFLTAFFTGTMKINHFGDVKYTILLANSGHSFKSFGRMFWFKLWPIYVFSIKSQKFAIFLGKMQETSALETNIDSFQQSLVKYLPFPHIDTSLMTKIWLKGLHLFQYRRC